MDLFQLKNNHKTTTIKQTRKKKVFFDQNPNLENEAFPPTTDF